MARPGGILKFSGKLGNEVHVDSRAYGNHIRKAARPGNKKKETALQLQYRRTGYLNKIASEINRVMQQQAASLKTSDFYQRLLRLFRRSEQDNRIHLLLQLKGMDINPRYPMHRLGIPELNLLPGRNKLEVELMVKSPPVPPKSGNPDGYCYEVLLLTWGSNEKPPAHKLQYSDWCTFKGGLSEFVFAFDKPRETVHWLLAVRIRFGQSRKEIDNLEAMGMQIIGAGTLNKKEQKQLQELEALKLKRQKESIDQVNEAKPEPIRVKARRVG